MRITLGNLNQKLNGPSNPTAVDQLITAAGNFKFTVHGAKAGTELGPLAMNIPFAHWYGINQTQFGGGKDGVVFGFCDGAGNWVGARGQDQGMSMIGTAQSGGGLYWKAEFLKGGDYTFGGGAG